MTGKRDSVHMGSGFIAIMHGLTGTGKSTVARLIGRTLSNTVVFHSAVIRVRLGLTPDNFKRSGEQYEFSLDDSTFTKKVSQVVYQEMIQSARQAIKDGKNVVLDGSFSMSWQRKMVYGLVSELKLDCWIVHCVCVDEVNLHSRITSRQGKEDPFSEASSWSTYLSLRDKSDSLNEDFQNLDFPLWLIKCDSSNNTVEKQAIGKAKETKALYHVLELLASGLGAMETNRGSNAGASDKKVLALDFDGVITEPHYLKTQEFLKLGFDVLPEHTERDYCTKRLGIPLNVYEQASYNANVARLMEIPLAPGAQRALSNLVTQKVRLVIITSRTTDEVRDIVAYLTINKIRIDDIIHTNRESKVEALLSISPLMYVDDSPLKLEELVLLKNWCSLFLYRNVANDYWVAPNSLSHLIQGTWTDIEVWFNRVRNRYVSIT